MTAPNLPIIPKSLDNLIDQTANPLAKGFIQWVLLKLGLSEEILKAKNKVVADKIQKKWEMELPYFVILEAKKLERQYSNFGIVLQKIFPLITASKPNIKDDNDFFWGLLEHSKEISNEEMQELIAKILAGEYNVPGTYSMCTLQVIKMLGKDDLELFEKMGSLLVDGEYLPQILFSGQDNVKDVMQKVQLDFEKLQALQNLGLFLPNDMRRTITIIQKQNITIQYFDKELIYVPENDNYQKIELPGFYGLSIVGKQILKHLNPKYLEEYYLWLKENYKIANYKIKE